MWTLGRQCLLDPVEFTEDGWFRMTGGDFAQAIAKPEVGTALPHGMPLSNDFSAPLALGAKWSFFRPAPDEVSRLRVADGGYHHNVRGGFLMLRPGLYAAGPGEAKFRDFRFTAL